MWRKVFGCVLGCMDRVVECVSLCRWCGVGSEELLLGYRSELCISSAHACVHSIMACVLRPHWSHTVPLVGGPLLSQWLAPRILSCYRPGHHTWFGMWLSCSCVNCLYAWLCVCGPLRVR